MLFKHLLFPAIVIVSLAQGCSFSHSSKSSSESSASSSKSSASLISSPSSVSSSLTEEEYYQKEIVDYTSAYLSKEQFDIDTFNRGISEIATENGITSWEQNDATFIAIGRGIKKANLPEGVYQTYKSSIAGSNQHLLDLIQQGYEE